MARPSDAAALKFPGGSCCHCWSRRLHADGVRTPGTEMKCPSPLRFCLARSTQILQHGFLKAESVVVKMMEHRESITSTADTLTVRVPYIERIPYPVAYFLGYRKAQPPPDNPYIRILWSFVGIFGSIASIGVVSRQIPLFREHGGPIIVGSFVCHPNSQSNGVDPSERTDRKRDRRTDGLSTLRVQLPCWSSTPSIRR